MLNPPSLRGIATVNIADTDNRPCISVAIYLCLWGLADTLGYKSQTTVMNMLKKFKS